jgi:hypothetical protein
MLTKTIESAYIQTSGNLDTVLSLINTATQMKANFLSSGHKKLISLFGQIKAIKEIEPKLNRIKERSLEELLPPVNPHTKKQLTLF